MTARRAGMLIAVVTVVVTIAAGVLMRVLDHSEFPNVWLALWWSVQTVTTVGYGDITPENVVGRTIATIVMPARGAVRPVTSPFHRRPARPAR